MKQHTKAKGSTPRTIHVHRLGTSCFFPFWQLPSSPRPASSPWAWLLPLLTPALQYTLSISSFLPWSSRSGNPSTTLPPEHPAPKPNCTGQPQRLGSRDSIFVGYPLHLPQPTQLLWKIQLQPRPSHPFLLLPFSSYPPGVIQHECTWGRASRLLVVPHAHLRAPGTSSLFPSSSSLQNEKRKKSHWSLAQDCWARPSAKNLSSHTQIYSHRVWSLRNLVSLLHFPCICLFSPALFGEAPCHCFLCVHWAICPVTCASPGHRERFPEAVTALVARRYRSCRRGPRAYDPSLLQQWCLSSLQTKSIPVIGSTCHYFLLCFTSKATWKCFLNFLKPNMKGKSFLLCNCTTFCWFFGYFQACCWWWAWEDPKSLNRADFREALALNASEFQKAQLSTGA